MPKNSRDLTMFRAQFDKGVQIRKRLKEALAAMAKLGPEEWRTEREFIDAAKVSCNDIGDYRDEFKEHIVEVPSANGSRSVTKRVWFASPKVAAKVRQK